MELSKSEVKLTVDLRKCDSTYAVYNILLQEEIKRVKSATKTALPLKIEADSSSTSVPDKSISEKRTNTEKEKNAWRPQTVSQKHRRCLFFGRKPQKRSEKDFNEQTSVVGKRIEIDSLKRSSLEDTTFEKKGKDEIEKWVDDIKSIQSGEVSDLKSLHNCEDYDEYIILDSEVHVSTQIFKISFKMM